MINYNENEKWKKYHVDTIQIDLGLDMDTNILKFKWQQRDSNLQQLFRKRTLNRLAK